MATTIRPTIGMVKAFDYVTNPAREALDRGRATGRYAREFTLDFGEIGRSACEVFECEANGRHYRARVMNDNDPLPPEGDCYPLILEIEARWGTSALRAIPWSLDSEGFAEILSALVARHYSDLAIEIFERYVRVFHGGDVEVMQDRRGTLYVLVVTEHQWVDVWGNPDTRNISADHPEFAAYLEGEVYGIDVESADDDEGEPNVWESDDLEVWGIYGTEYAAREALEALAAKIDVDAARLSGGTR